MLCIYLLYYSKTPEFTFSMIVVAVMIAIFTGKPDIGYFFLHNFFTNHGHRERQFGYPGFSGQLILYVKVGRTFIFNFCLFAEVVLRLINRCGFLLLIRSMYRMGAPEFEGRSDDHTIQEVLVPNRSITESRL